MRERAKSRELHRVKRNLSSWTVEVPGWLEVDMRSCREGSVVPTREQIDAPVREQLIVELYSK